MNLVETACEALWAVHASDCSGFVRAVADAVGVALPLDNADGLLLHVSSSPSGFRILATAHEAVSAAGSGDFVLAGVCSFEHTPPREHGHVVVVTGAVISPGGYPTAYWGMLGGQGSKAKTLNYAWKASDRERIRYFSKGQ